MMEDIVKRPWGYYQVIQKCENYQIKKIVVFPHSQLSYQSHKYRNEHWFFIKGDGVVILDGKESKVKDGCSVDIKSGIKHRIKNISNDEVCFLEIQTGTYFGEDDIIRYEDDYGRIG